jgi:thioredoxin reductase
MFDAIIVGGSYAGISAATQLARARRNILVVDGGKRRNRFAAASHGFLGRDGASAAGIVAEARAQLLAYPTVTWRDGEATAATGASNGFALTLGAEMVEGRRLVLAIGVADELPAIPGLAERWGKSVFHCPYCHGYEIEGTIGVLAVAPTSIHHALMLPDWGPTTYFLNGTPMPQGPDFEKLVARGVVIEPEPIAAIGGTSDVVLAGGRTVPMGGLFTATRTEPASPLADMLGCALEESPAGHFIRTDMMRETTVPGVFACGDAARPFGNVALAVGDGVQAGAGTHASLLFR